MNHPHVENETGTAATAPAPRQASAEGTGHQAIAGPFGLRDIVVGSAVLVMLVGSVLPFTIGSGLNLWTAFSLFYVGIGIIMPLLAAGLFIARRLSPAARLRVGSLSVDQFASVIAVLAVIFFFLQLVYVFSVGSLIGLIGSAVLVAATTFAPHIPPFSEEFQGRKEIPAHPVARDAQPLRRAPKPAPAPKPAEGPASAPAGSFNQNAAGHGQMAPEARTQDRADAAAGHGDNRFHDGRSPQAGSPQAGSAQTGAQGYIPGAGAAAAGAAAAGAAGAGAAGTGATGAAAGTHPGTPAADGTGVTAGAGTESPSDASRRPANQHQDQDQNQAPAGEDSLPATTVNPAVSSGTPSSSAHPATQAQESISATREENENVVEAFWFAVGTPRQIVDERTGLPLFMFYPGDWELGLEDRGHEFLVQDKRTGRIGVLRDLTNIERVSDDSSGH